MDIVDIDESQKQFGKIITFAIVLLCCTIAIAVVLGIIQAEAWGWPAAVIATRAGLNSAASIALAAVLLVLAIIGKMNTMKNGIMAFVFGIITLVCAAGIIADRASNVGGWIENLVDEIGDLPQSDALIEVPLRIVQLGLFGVIIGMAIPSIMASVNVIKATKDATTSTSKASTGVSRAASPQASVGRSQFCSSCGASLDAGAQFCNKCGAKV